MILLSELSRRRIRSINKLVRVNRTEIVMVIRVDKEKGVYNCISSAILFLQFDSAVWCFHALLALRIRNAADALFFVYCRLH